ncbi:MAG: hypothetical protein PUB37_04675, partial [Firmicutes bacterium]|nr:hypothetical protein [Bacillota bacterium]
MNQDTYTEIIRDQTDKAVWEVQNVIDCIPDEMWDRAYCGMPLWKHVYHTLHSLDLWYINPNDPNYSEPSFHTENLNNLDAVSEGRLTRPQINDYFSGIKSKLNDYLDNLTDGQLLKYPECCEYTRFTLIMAQFRHLHSHMGMLMGFIIQ